MRIFYTILYLHLLPFVVLRLYWRSLKSPGYRQRIGERFAKVPVRTSDAPLLWVHAVSVGETIAATPLVKAWQEQHPDWQICITTTTPTGSDRVKAAFGDTVLHYYLPYDVPSLLMRFINRLKPRALVIMETELWPNLLALCEEQKLPAFLVNGRMSERSFRGYQRFSGLTQPMFQALSAIAAQSAQDTQHFVELGASPDNVITTGSIKFDVQLDDKVIQRRDELANQLKLSDRKILVFASTHPGEDELIAPVVARLCQRDSAFLAVMVPRHPERFEPVFSLCEKHQLNTVRITDNQAVNAQTQVVLGDTMGDMLALYGLASACFIGGSLIEHGGHNFLEAAAWGIPIFTGDHVFNFQAIADQLVDAGGLVKIRDQFALERELVNWLGDSESYSAVGHAAKQVLDDNRGALTKALNVVVERLPQSESYTER